MKTVFVDFLYVTDRQDLDVPGSVFDLLRGAQLDVPIANELVEQGLEAGLVLNHIGDSILRFLPPLVVSYEQIDEMADRLGALIEKLA